MRFASWIAEKMTKDDFWSSEAYSDGRSRQTSHSKAWRCTKREERKRGLHFKLHDCVAWMRLNFLALRESGEGRDWPAACLYNHRCRIARAPGLFGMVHDVYSTFYSGL